MDGRQLAGLRGWLLVLGAWLLVGLITWGGGAWRRLEYLTQGGWEALTNESSRWYDPLWAQVIFVESAVLTLGGLWLCVAIGLYFSKKSLFVPVLIAFCIFDPLYPVIKSMLHHIIWVDIHYALNFRALLGNVLSSAIVIMYLLRSRRVQQTFLN